MNQWIIIQLNRLDWIIHSFNVQPWIAWRRIALHYNLQSYNIILSLHWSLVLLMPRQPCKPYPTVPTNRTPPYQPTVPHRTNQPYPTVPTNRTPPYQPTVPTVPTNRTPPYQPTVPHRTNQPYPPYPPTAPPYRTPRNLLMYHPVLWSQKPMDSLLLKLANQAYSNSHDTKRWWLIGSDYRWQM